MRNTFWKIKNSYAAKARADQEARERGKRDTLRSRHNEESRMTSSLQEDPQDVVEFPEQEAKESNFEQLKKEIRYLENSQIMSMKYRRHTEPEETDPYQFKNTGKEFFPSKKVAHF
jgi:hypothetical protein